MKKAKKRKKDKKTNLQAQEALPPEHCTLSALCHRCDGVVVSGGGSGGAI
jgi:hypothetical protein